MFFFQLNHKKYDFSHSTRARAHFLVAVLQIFEVTSTTTIRELCDSVASQLQLGSVTGYGLYLKTRKKVRLRVSLRCHVTSQAADMLCLCACWRGDFGNLMRLSEHFNKATLCFFR